MKHWLAALRLKTLPLALGAIVLGSNLHRLSFRTEIFLFAALTAIFLQILSNLANDYGDYIKGTDRHRLDRQLAGGNISPGAMKVAIGFFTLLSLASGIYLLFIAFENNWKLWFMFFGLGLLSIVAAISYTVGKKAYGYYGLGDLFVMLFFGLVGVIGTAFLYKQEIHSVHFLPAIAYGCLCVGVLNVNNIRDLDKDILANKITLASKLGKTGAISYQMLLIISASLLLILHLFATGYISLAPVAVAIVGYIHIKKIQQAETPDDYNEQLKFLSLSSLGIVFLFALRFYL